MEHTRHAEVEQVVRKKELNERTGGPNFLHREREVLINEAIEDELGDSSKHPLHAALVNPVLVFIIISSLKRGVVDNRKEGEAKVGQQKEIGHRPRPAERRLLMSTV